MKPTAWLSPEGLLIPHGRFMALPKSAREGTPLYPRKEWQGLTDEEVVARANEEGLSEAFARGVAWAELKLKEKNT